MNSRFDGRIRKCVSFRGMRREELIQGEADTWEIVRRFVTSINLSRSTPIFIVWRLDCPILRICFGIHHYVSHVCLTSSFVHHPSQSQKRNFSLFLERSAIEAQFRTLSLRLAFAWEDFDSEGEPTVINFGCKTKLWILFGFFVRINYCR